MSGDERAARDLSTGQLAPRCLRCCDHGIPRDGGRWCGWCEDAADGYGDAVIEPSQPMWLCPHGIGGEPGDGD